MSSQLRSLPDNYNPGVKAMIDISTDCLDMDVDAPILQAAAEYGYRFNGCPRVVEHSYGYTLFVMRGDTERESELQACSEAGYSDALIAAVRYAHQNNAYVLNFDRDGDYYAEDIARACNESAANHAPSRPTP